GERVGLTGALVPQLIGGGGWGWQRSCSRCGSRDFSRERKRVGASAPSPLSGLVGALTLARGVDDSALRRKSWSRRVVRLGRDYSVSLAQLRARPRRQCDGISAGAR